MATKYILCAISSSLDEDGPAFLTVDVDREDRGGGGLVGADRRRSARRPLSSGRPTGPVSSVRRAPPSAEKAAPASPGRAISWLLPSGSPWRRNRPSPCTRRNALHGLRMRTRHSIRSAETRKNSALDPQFSSGTWRSLAGPCYAGRHTNGRFGPQDKSGAMSAGDERFGSKVGSQEAVLAATVILLRDGESGLETLMLRRDSKIAFGGMSVFPGGRLRSGGLAGALARRRVRGAGAPGGGARGLRGVRTAGRGGFGARIRPLDPAAGDHAPALHHRVLRGKGLRR